MTLVSILGDFHTSILPITYEFKEKHYKTYEEKMDTQKFHVFGVTSIISTKEFIIGHSDDALSKHIYDKYTKTAADKELPVWDHLSNFYKDSNNASADHQIIKCDTWYD